VDETTWPFAVAKARDPSDSSGEFARKQVLAKPYLANPEPINQQNYDSNQPLARWFRAD
jgi:hypothetical protein